jgi:transposase-like protein
MKPTDFQRWLTQADELTPFQRERALETLTSQNPERACADVIEERVADERRCPRCDMPGATRHGMANGLQRYRCDHCRRTFNALTGTPLAGLRKKEKWLEYAEALNDGVTIEKAAERCGVDPTTAFRWRHLDFADAPEMFAGEMVIALDRRLDYGETRFIGFGPSRGG